MATKADKDKLDEGAEKIRKAKADAEKVVQLNVREIPHGDALKAVIENKVVWADGHIGIKKLGDVTLEESVGILQWTMALNDHVQFMVGDIVNLSRQKWGDPTIKQAAEKVDLDYKTIHEYAATAKIIPLDKRIAALPFSQHAVIARLRDKEKKPAESKIDKVLAEVSAKIKDDEIPTVSDVRDKVSKLQYKRPPTSGKGKGKGKPATVGPVFEPDAEQRAKMDLALEALENAAKLCWDDKVFTLVKQIDKKERHNEWMPSASKMYKFYTELSKAP